MRGGSQPEFFVGYAPAPPQLARFSLKVAGLFLAASLVLALVLGSQVRDTGEGRYTGEIRATGVMVSMPYPLLRLPASADYPRGHTLLVAGGGKTGAGVAAQKLEGAVVEIAGFGLKRGTLDMIVAEDASNMQRLANAGLPALEAPFALGRYRIAGEICDGKCYPGGMRPGTGLAHKACANLCLIGEQPAIFATQAPLDGQSFLLLANSDGKLPPPVLYDYTGLPVELEGEVVRLGDLLIFRADWSSIRKQ